MKYLILFSLFVHQINSIYHGQEAKVNKFSYVVLIQGSESFCSGTIISNRHILTSAQCLYKEDEVTVHVGAQNYDENEDETDGIQYKSNKFLIHQSFQMPAATHDIAIIRLKKPLKFNSKVKKISMSKEMVIEIPDGDIEVTLAGWGYSEGNDGISETLQYAELTLIETRECRKLKDNYIEQFLFFFHLCMERIKGMPCSGDMGAPVVSKRSKKLVGILSFIKDADGSGKRTKNDCEANVPAVALRISEHYDWIQEKIGKQNDQNDESDNNDDDESDSEGDDNSGSEDDDESESDNDESESDNDDKSDNEETVEESEEDNSDEETHESDESDESSHN